LFDYRRRIVERTAVLLDKYEMMRFNMNTGMMMSTDTGRLASHYYIRSDTVEVCLFFFVYDNIFVCFTDYCSWGFSCEINGCNESSGYYKFIMSCT
jgi:hypothetical protein